MKSSVLLKMILLGWLPVAVIPKVDIERGKSSKFIIVDFDTSKRLILTEAEVDGKKGFFLFDTGASHLTLNQKHFPEKRATRSNYATSNIHAKQAHAMMTRVAKFQWGGIRRKKLDCPITDLSALENWLGHPILGLIGFDIIRDYEVHLDYKNQTITMASGKKRGIAEQVPPSYTLDFDLCGHLPVLEVNVGAKRKAYLGLDSGASANILDDDWQEEVAKLALVRSNVALAGAGKEQKQAEKFIMEQITLENKIALYHARLILTEFDIPTGRCFQVDGLMGIDAFACKRVAIDYKKHKLRIWLEEGEAFAVNCK